MKHHTLLLSLLMIFSAQQKLSAQSDRPEKTGLPGDNLNLAAVLDVFQRSKTLEVFEEALNREDNKINNLDLNLDGKVDYIKVSDFTEGNLHRIVLTTDVNEKETQDIAVIYVEKTGNDVRIQLVGDEDLYGKDYLIEPATDPEKGTPNPGYREGDTYITNNYYNTDNNYYNTQPAYAPPVRSWVIVDYLYGPAYVVWRSPWYWGFYPGWFIAWSPFYWDVYYNYWYYTHPWNGWWYWRCAHNHFHHHHRSYYEGRHRSQMVAQNYSSGNYQGSYNNPQPVNLSIVKPNFPSHSLSPEQNPAIGKKNLPPVKEAPTGRAVEKQPERPAQPLRPNELPPATKPGVDDKPAPVKPNAPSPPVNRPALPVTRPAERPVQQPKQPPVAPQRPVTPKQPAQPPRNYNKPISPPVQKAPAAKPISPPVQRPSMPPGKIRKQ